MKTKSINKLYATLTFLCVIFITQMILTVYQVSRFEEDVYDCSDMSLDCGKYFSFIGIKTRYVNGWYYDNTTDCGKSFHIWLELDFILFKLPFETTALLFIPPTVIKNYNELKIMEYYTDNLIEIWGNDIFIR